MAFSPSFSVSQLVGSDSIISIVDTSTGSDGLITERHIYLRKADGSFLVPTGTNTDYIVWLKSEGDTINIDCLDKDYSLQITTEWGSAITSIPVTGLWAWYDAALGVTGTTDILEWQDQSGNLRDLTASIGAEPSLVSNAINGLPAISSYGLTCQMSTAVNFADLSNGGTIFLVGKESNVNGATNSDINGVFIGAGAITNMNIQRGTTTSGVAAIRGGINAGTYVTTSLILPESTFGRIRLKNNGATNYISVNNGTEGSAAADGSGYIATPLTVFKSLGNAQGNKQIAEIIIYTRELSTSEITQVETYLATKYAL